MKIINAIYKAVKKRIGEETTDSGIATKWGNQEDRKFDDEPVFAVPFAHIYFPPIQFTALSGGLDRGKQLRFSVRVGVESYADVDTAVALACDFGEEVYLALKGFSCNYAYISNDETDTDILLTTVRLVDIIPDHEQSNLIVIEYVFETTAHNRTAIRSKQAAQASPKITATYE
jgi:hypothetical protein